MKRYSIAELEGLLSGTTPGEWNEDKIGTVFRSTSVSGECGRKVLMVEVKDDDGRPHSDSQRKNAVLMIQARNLATELLETKAAPAYRGTFKVDHPGESGAGIAHFTDVVRIEVESGDPGGGPNEFMEHMLDALKEWYDGARVSVREEGAADGR